MPREVNQNLLNLLQNGGHYDTLELMFADGTIKRLSHAPIVINGQSFAAHFGLIEYKGGEENGGSETCGIESIAFALGAEVDRLSVKIQNVDAVVGADVVSSVRRLSYAKARGGKYFFSGFENGANTEHAVTFAGAVVGMATVEAAATLSIVSDIIAAGRCVSVKTLSGTNTWKFVETEIPQPPVDVGGGIGGYDQGNQNDGGGGFNRNTSYDPYSPYNT